MGYILSGTQSTQYISSRMKKALSLLLPFLVSMGYSVGQEKGVTNGEWSPGPCFPLCTTGPAQTSPPPERGCIKTDCFDEPLCAEMCEVINQCYSYEWVLNNDDNDIFGETWCAVTGYGMCYCCDCI